ncbi:MAG: hypothetical protein KJZ58_02785 [Flavobacteriales bacterium]|nr:hypothetical protein [Flavobacteriales bacterium]MCL4281169.1 hypothetical protein [Flavobacteriales bacterium]
MTGIKLSFILACLALALRIGLHYGGVHVAPFGFIPVHLLFLVVAVFLSGHLLLNHDPSRGMGELLRAGFQSALLYALLIAVGIWFFYKGIDTRAFSDYNARLVEGFVQQGHAVDEARERVEKLYNPTSYAAITFFGLFITGAFNAMATAALHHKVLRRYRRKQA